MTPTLTLGADILPFERGMRLLRGVDAETQRKQRIRELWIAARRRAYNGMVYESDVAMFGLPALAAELAGYLRGRTIYVQRAQAPAAV